MTLDEAIRAGRRRLAEAGVAGAGLDARVLAGDAFGLDAAALLRHGPESADPARLAVLDGLIARRCAGEPVGRILGRREFHGLMFALGPDTLEPRPDTETLVDHALALVRAGAVPGAAPDGGGLLFADIGTGSGAIAVALAVALPRARGIATDISAGALRVAAANAARHDVADRLEFRSGSWLDPLAERCGLILSNPPYVETAEIADLAPDVRNHDPRAALDGGPDGLAGYRALAAGAPARLLAEGTIAVEIGWRQGSAVEGILAAAGLSGPRRIADLAGHDRVVTARRL